MAMIFATAPGYEQLFESPAHSRPMPEVAVPENGELTVKTFEPFMHWHKHTAAYRNGQNIPTEISTTNPVSLSNTFPDEEHSIEEQRFVIIGLSDQGRILVVAHTDDGELVRIVSAREATDGERKAYEES